MSTTPSRAWSNSCGGVPPSCIELYIWILMRPLDSSSIFLAQGVNALEGTVPCGGRNWCRRRGTSCANAPTLAETARASAATLNVQDRMNISGWWPARGPDERLATRSGVPPIVIFHNNRRADCLGLTPNPRRKHRTGISARGPRKGGAARPRSEEHTSELQSQSNLVCRLLLEKRMIAPLLQHHYQPEMLSHTPSLHIL